LYLFKTLTLEFCVFFLTKSIIFRDSSASKSERRDYINNYRKFSIALDICTINAAKKALTELKKKYDEQTKDELEDLVKKYKQKFNQSRKKKREGKEKEASMLKKQDKELLRKARDL